MVLWSIITTWQLEIFQSYYQNDTNDLSGRHISCHADYLSDSDFASVRTYKRAIIPEVENYLGLNLNSKHKCDRWLILILIFNPEIS